MPVDAENVIPITQTKRDYRSGCFKTHSAWSRRAMAMERGAARSANTPFAPMMHALPRS